MATVLFLVDAFSSKYVIKERAPFLHSLTKRSLYYKKVKQSVGFCERSEIATGKASLESGFLTAIGYKKYNNQFSQYKSILQILHVVEKIIDFVKLSIIKQRLRKYIYKIFQKINPNIILKPYNIPFNILPYFDLTEDKQDLWDINEPGEKNLFKDIIESGYGFDVSMFTSLRNSSELATEEKFDMLEKVLATKYKGVIFVYIADTDIIAHKYGIASDELNSAILNIDQRLSKVIKKHSEENKFIVLGDHGMLDVERRIDAGEIVKSLADLNKLRNGVDYMYFLDSTILRIWIMSKSDATEKFLYSVKNDPVLNSNGDDSIFPGDSHDRKYGDYIWYANPSVLIYPDYFQGNEPYKAMHGYDTEISQHMGTCIAYGENIVPAEIEMIYLHEMYNVIKEHMTRK
jgi:hypothetical protein